MFTLLLSILSQEKITGVAFSILIGFANHTEKPGLPSPFFVAPLAVELALIHET